MRWFFLSDTQEQIPTTEDQLPGLVQEGILRSQSLVWQEGTEDWRTLGECQPELFPPGAAARTTPAVVTRTPAVYQLTSALAQRHRWMAAAGVLMVGLGLGILVVAALLGATLVQQWRVQSATLEAAQMAGSRVSWAVCRVVFLVVQSAGWIWMGALVLRAMTQLRVGILTGEWSASQAGLRALGKYFFVLSITLVLAALGGLLLVGFLPKP